MAIGAPTLKIGGVTDGTPFDLGGAKKLSVMSVCVGITGCKARPLKLGIYCFAAMEWVCNVGYEMFPWVSGAAATEPQNVMHFIVTVLIVALSLAALILIIVGAKGKDLTALRIWAIICLAAMLIGPMGTALLPAKDCVWAV